MKLLKYVKQDSNIIYSNIQIIIFFSIFLIISLSYIHANADKPSLFQNIIIENSKIKSLDSNITQYINTNEGSPVIFKGRYRVDNNGRFRIDYSLPSKQIVINDGANLYWYYPEEKILYTIGNEHNSSSAPKINPLKKFSKNPDNRFNVNYLGKHLFGFFIIAHQFLIMDQISGKTFEIWIDAKRRVILAKIVKDKDGREIIKENYGEYRKISQGGSREKIYFPLQIDVYARTNLGITRNSTHYDNVRLNLVILKKIFHIDFPDDIKKKYLYK